MIFLSSSSSRGVRSCRPVEARHFSVKARGGEIGLGEGAVRSVRGEALTGVVPSDAERKASPAALASSFAMVIRRVLGLS